MQSFEIPGMPGANVDGKIGIFSVNQWELKKVKEKMTVKESHEILVAQESDKMIERIRL